MQLVGRVVLNAPRTRFGIHNFGDFRAFSCLATTARWGQRALLWGMSSELGRLFVCFFH